VDPEIIGLQAVIKKRKKFQIRIKACSPVGTHAELPPVTTAAERAKTAAN